MSVYSRQKDEDSAQEYDFEDVLSGQEVDTDKIATEEIIQRKTNSNVRNLQDFLKKNHKFLKERRSPETNIINLGTKSPYGIHGADLQHFLVLLEECRKSGCMIHFQEKQDAEYSGLMIDFDRYQVESSRQITQKHFHKLASIMSKLLLKYVDLENPIDCQKHDKKLSVHFFYIQKPRLVIDEASIYAKKTNNIVYKDGFHVLIPEIQISRPLKKYIYKEFQEKFTEKIFNDIDCTLQPAKEMFDPMSSSVNVCFFGNSKKGKPPYELVCALEVELDFDLEDASSIIQIPLKDLHRYNMVYELSLSTYYEKIPNAEKHLRRTFLKKKKYDHVARISEAVQFQKENFSGGIDEEDICDNENSISVLTMVDADAKLLKEMLGILDISYAEEYGKWRNVIFAIADANVEYRPLAVWFSQRSPKKWDEVSFCQLWSEATSKRYQGTPITKRSIFYWAKESNPQRFEEIRQVSYKAMLAKYAYEYEGAIEQGMLAKVLKLMVGDKFIAEVLDDSNKRNNYIWYEFVLPGQAHKRGEIYKWRREIQPEVLHLYIQEQVPKVYQQILDDIKERKEKSTKESEVKYLHKMESTLKLYRKKLFGNNFQNGVIEQSRFHFRQRGFLEELDNYDDAIGVGNGILKLGKEIKLIKGFHEYKISKYTEVDYIPYCRDNPYIQLIEDAFEKSFPEPDAREWWKLYFSLFCDPSDVDAVFGIMVGGGSNGKSFWVELISNTLGGSYSVKIPISLLTSAREQSDRANSAFMAVENKLFVYFSEPDGPETFNSGRLKEMFSGEKQAGRDLHGKHRNFRMRASPLAISNYDFHTDCTDHGFWRRCHYYNTKIKFCKEPNPENKYERKEDEKFIKVYKKDPDVMKAMLSFMVYYNNILHVKYGGSIKNVPCETIKRETEMFRNRQDTINRFITEMLVVREEYCEVPIGDVVSAYVEWYNRNIKQLHNHDLGGIRTKFENSSIASNLVRKDTQALVLTYHRIRGGVNEPLREGERFRWDKRPVSSKEDTKKDDEAPPKESFADV